MYCTVTVWNWGPCRVGHQKTTKNKNCTQTNYKLQSTNQPRSKIAHPPFYSLNQPPLLLGATSTPKLFRRMHMITLPTIRALSGRVGEGCATNNTNKAQTDQSNELWFLVLLPDQKTIKIILLEVLVVLSFVFILIHSVYFHTCHIQTLLGLFLFFYYHVQQQAYV